MLRSVEHIEQGAFDAREPPMGYHAVFSDDIGEVRRFDPVAPGIADHERNENLVDASQIIACLTRAFGIYRFEHFIEGDHISRPPQLAAKIADMVSVDRTPAPELLRNAPIKPAPDPFRTAAVHAEDDRGDDIEGYHCGAHEQIDVKHYLYSHYPAPPFQ